MCIGCRTLHCRTALQNGLDEPPIWQGHQTPSVQFRQYLMWVFGDALWVTWRLLGHYTNCGLFKLWHIRIMAYSNYDLYKLWHIQIMTYKNHDTYKLWHTNYGLFKLWQRYYDTHIMTYKKYGIYKLWHLKMMTYKLWHIQIMLNVIGCVVCMCVRRACLGIFVGCAHLEFCTKINQTWQCDGT